MQTSVHVILLGHYLKYSHRRHIIIADLYTLFRTEYLGIFMAYICGEFQTSCSYDSVVITVKQKSKY
jgi:hypothetical protein